MCQIYTIFKNCLDVGETLLQLLSDVAMGARDKCSSMPEISILHVTSKIRQRFGQIFMSHTSHFLH